MKRYAWIAMKLQALRNCEALAIESEWEARHTQDIDYAMRNTAPSGSGFDSGTELNMAKSNDKRIIFTTAFHHTNDAGYYTGWTYHKVIITPAFDGYDMRVTGPNKRDIKYYIVDMFDSWLNEEVE